MGRTAAQAGAELVGRGRTLAQVRSIALARRDAALLAWADNQTEEDNDMAKHKTQAADTTAAAPLPVADIAPSPRNRAVTDESVAELAASLAELGLLQPIVVRAAGAGYEIVCGERRWRAARALGWDAIAATVVEADDETAQGMRLCENLQRVDVPPLEQAEGVAWLLERHDGNAAEVAARLGVEVGWVYRRARLCHLADCWRAELADPETEYEYLARRVTMQEELARLPTSVQEEMHGAVELVYAETAAALRQKAERRLRRLADRPWDDAFCSDCVGCEDRSDAASRCGLFPEWQGDGSARCLWPECWQNHLCEWLTAQVDRADVLISDNYCTVGQLDEWTADLVARAEASGRPFLNGWSAREPRDGEDDPAGYDRQQALIVHGARVGQIVEVLVRQEENDGGDEDGSEPTTSAPRPLPRANSLTPVGRAAAAACRALLATVRPMDGVCIEAVCDPPTVLRLIAQFGVDPECLVADQVGQVWRDMPLVPRSEDLERLLAALWPAVIESLYWADVEYLVESGLDTPERWTELAEVFGEEGLSERVATAWNEALQKAETEAG
jgi:ParB/RepB/Spo0J family partition protein